MAALTIVSPSVQTSAVGPPVGGGSSTDAIVIAVLVALGVGMFLGSLGLARLLSPRVITAEKLTTYESGVNPQGEGWTQIHARYYLYAFCYVIFAVDAVYLFPWVAVLRSLGGLALAEMALFLAVLVVGLVFAIGRGLLKWR